MRSATYLAITSFALLFYSGYQAEQVLGQTEKTTDRTGDGGSDLDGIPGWAKGSGIIAGLVAGPGFAVWFAWYMTTKRIPEIERNHAAQITESEKRHSDHITLLINNFRSDQVEMWKIKREDDKAWQDVVSRLADKSGEQVCQFVRAG